MENIIKRRFKDNPEISEKISDFFIRAAISHFKSIRKLTLKKPPSTAELLAWINILQLLDLDITNLTKDIKHSYTVLAKNKEDLETMEKFLIREIDSLK